MRYYNITLQNATSGAVVRQWTSHPNGLQRPPDPGALDIEFDLLVYNFDEPAGGSTVTIYGVSLEDISQAQQFAGMILTVSGGMGKGLPLANPQQAGLLFSGKVMQSFGNWVGTQMTLDLVVNASTYTFDNPGNFVLNWPAGTPLQGPLAQMLSAAYPGYKQTIQISPALVLPNTEVHVCSTLSGMASYIQGITKGLVNSTYNGVSITINGGQIFCYDNTNPGAPTTLAFTDLIGQPTWIQPDLIQVQTVMRADLQVSSTIKMPQGLQNLPGIVSTTAESTPSSLKYKSSFQGQFAIVSLRQLGHFRSANGQDWASIFQCAPLGAVTTTQ